ncbi:MAG: hypothetical protein Ct9H300mP1_00160 [Planctomycetaceae bacterium]|nr:MAG: hypothetical protein Ct9H300mP1_00160 [Planctomycetaceae bacterium]
MGAILFTILIVVQFLVITRGSTRVSEVAAKFALEAMPGRQKAIDSDVTAGLITREEAQIRRTELASQADFYGAMDGAGKFVRGDAVAGIVITLTNIGGGLFVGMVQGGMPLSQSVDVFTRLTIGDGLVTQVPALLLSLAAGLIVTRSSTDRHLPSAVVGKVVRTGRSSLPGSGIPGRIGGDRPAGRTDDHTGRHLSACRHRRAPSNGDDRSHRDHSTRKPPGRR